MEPKRSPIYSELANYDGSMPKWPDFVVHLEHVAAFEALSEHRTFLQDLLRSRDGHPCSYDWTDSGGRLPYTDVETEQLQFQEQSLDRRVRARIAARDVAIPPPSVWTRDGSRALWSSGTGSLDSLEAASVLGRGLRSACPAKRRSIRLLLPLYDAVLGGTGIFTDIQLPPIDDVERVARLCLQHQDGPDDRLSLILATYVSGDVQLPKETQAHVEVRAVVRRPDLDGLHVKTAAAEYASTSPLANQPTISRAHLMKLHASMDADDFVIEDEFGRPREFGEGALVWAVPGGWRTIAPDIMPRVNVLVSHAQSASLATAHFPESDLEVTGPVYRVTPEGNVDTVATWNGRGISADPVDKESLRRGLRLGA